MAERRPLVLDANGRPAEMPVGDKVPSACLPPGGGGSSPLTTKGDLYGFDTGDARIPIGADGTMLAPDSTAALGVAYKNPFYSGGFIAGEAFSLNATTHNYSLGSASGWLKVTSNLATNQLTGLTGGLDGRMLFVSNVGSLAFRLSSENASSTASNRIHLGGGGTVSINEGQGVLLIYDGAASRWRMVGQPG